MLNVIRIILFTAFSMISLCILAAPGVSTEEQIALTGADIGSITISDLNNSEMIIEVFARYPADVDPPGEETMIGTIVVGDNIVIFGDGIVYSERWCHKTWIDIYFTADLPMDDTWYLENGSQCYIRICQYKFSKEDISELIAALATHEGQLLPGKGIWNNAVYADLRVIYNDREGHLHEVLGRSVGNQDNIELINTVARTIKELEWGKELEILEFPEFRERVDKKKEEYGWFPTKLNIDLYSREELHQ